MTDKLTKNSADLETRVMDEPSGADAAGLTDEKIEACLRNAVNEDAPDILDDLMNELGLESSAGAVKVPGAPIGTETARPVIVSVNPGLSTEIPAVSGKSVQEAMRRKRNRRIALATAAVMLFALFVGIRQMADRTFAVIGLDVNPSVELSIDRNERVISAEALNDDGKSIIAEMDLKGTDVNVACYALVGSMLTKGYLTDTSNSVLVSVRAGDAERGRALELEVAEYLDSNLKDSPVSTAVLGQYVEVNEELAAFADANSVSTGKAWLIKRLLASGSRHITEESLLKLTTQELVLLGQEKGLFSEVSYGEADTGKYIGRDNAVSAALDAAGIAETDAGGIKAEFDCEDGAIIYEVEFTAGGYEYEYDIDALTGSVIRYESETTYTVGDDDDDEDDDDDRIDDSDDEEDDDRDDVDDRDNDDDDDDDDRIDNRDDDDDEEDDDRDDD